MAKKSIIVVLAFAAAIGAYAFWRWVIDAGHSGPPTLSHEVTSVIDGQYVRDDGYVDYLKVLNDWRRGDTTPDDNACVELFRCFGPDQVDPDDWHARWKMVTDEPVPMGPFFEDLNKATNQDWSDEKYQGIRRPWEDDEFPDLLAWIDKNEEAAQKLVEATRRKSCYYPWYLDEGDDLVIGVKLQLTFQSREAARFLLARAMNHLGNDRLNECMDDLLAARSLGRLISQRGSLIENLVGIAIEGMTIEAEQTLIASRKLEQGQIDAWLARIEELPAFNDIAQSFDVAERYSALAMVQHIHHTGFSGVQGVSYDLPFLPVSFDIDVALKLMNENFDLVVAIAKEPASEAEDLVDAFLAHMVELERPHWTFAFQARAVLGGLKSRGEVVGSVLVGMLLPAVVQIVQANRRRVAEDRMSRLAFFLERHRLEDGQFPESIGALRLSDKTVTIDPFTESSFVYQKTETGFRLYSLGNNMADDGGLNSVENGQAGNADDWRFEVNFPADR